MATIELGSKTYTTDSKINHRQSSSICVYQLPGANSLQVAADVKAKIEKRQLTEKELPPVLPQFVRSQILMQPANFIDLKLIYEKFSLDINEESEGIQKLFRFLCPLIDILYSGKIFICDEIETHLHPTIVYEIINTFIQNRETNGQIIFTTHDTDLLDLDFIRRDQIWFTELKPENRSTDLYSLAELKNLL